MPISFEQVGYIYQLGTPMAYEGLKEASFTIEDNTYTAIIGHTGSGKSTVIQHLNALLKPTNQGVVMIDEMRIDANTKDKLLKPLRQKVGVVFQFPEAQLFEETVLKDVMFGPLNFGVSAEKARQYAVEALEQVGISETLFNRSPFELSGGQMRRVAIAGILAMHPKILVLDEPTAGLDPKGQKEMMALFQQLHQQGLTIVLVTHQMEDVAAYASHVVVLHQGKVVASDRPLAIFSDERLLAHYGLEKPMIMQLAQRLYDKGAIHTDACLTLDDLVEVICQKEAKHVR